MELYAAGFNAWGQLNFRGSSNEEDYEEPEDLTSFQCILKDQEIQCPVSLLSSTLVKTSTGVREAGFSSPFSEDHELRDKLLASRLAIAGNEKVAVLTSPSTVQQYASLTALRSSSNAEQTFTLQLSETHGNGITQIVAYETGFAALSTNGQVWTWGDERYSACLGREITEQTPAHQPALVDDLIDLPTGPVRKISAGGYTLFAISAGNDLYAWGGHPGQKPIIQGLSETPEPVDVHEQDILDCSVGGQHAIVLTVQAEVYVVGENINGQLGQSEASNTCSWVRINAFESYETIGVAAGSRTSFVLVKSVIS